MTEASQVPAADVELFAHWEPVRYFVAFDANGGTGAMTVQEHIYDARRALSGNQFTRDGHAFAGWSRSANGQVEYADGAEVVNLCEVAGETGRSEIAPYLAVTVIVRDGGGFGERLGRHASSVS